MIRRNINTIRLLGVVFFLLTALYSHADTAPVDEYKVKTGYLFNFTKFITWSDSNINTFNICILGHDPFGEFIDPIEQRTAFNRPIKLFRLNSIDKRLHCHIIYVSEEKSIPINTNNTLVVGDDSEFIRKGGMIAFIEKDNKIRLQINLKLLQQNGLRISAKLLEVSDIVGGSDD